MMTVHSRFSQQAESGEVNKSVLAVGYLRVAVPYATDRVGL